MTTSRLGDRKRKERFRARFARVNGKLWIFLSFYAICLLVLLPQLSLWLDEILDLQATRDGSVRTLLAWVPRNSAAVPLNYLAQYAAVHLLGFSAFAGRLPSALASIASCIGIYRVAARVYPQAALWATMLFAVFPLQLRYALEARPYSLALCITIWSTVFFLELIERFTALRMLAYGLLIVAGLYTQPFSVFVPVAHFLWASIAAPAQKRVHLALITGCAIAVAVLLFVPWYRYSIANWRRSVETYQFSFTARSLLMIFKELVGAGYLGTLSTLGFAIAGLAALRDARFRLLWVCLFAVPIVGAVLADAAFGYFLAIRQMIFALTPLAVLAAAGLYSTNPRKNVCLPGSLPALSYSLE